jgi:hypothetical protein
MVLGAANVVIAKTSTAGHRAKATRDRERQMMVEIERPITE